MFQFHRDDWLVTHSNCLDGAAVAVVFRHFGGNENHIVFSSPSHAQVDSIVLANRKLQGGHLYIADLSISQDAADKLNHRKDVYVIDHHKSAIPLAYKYDWCNIDINNTMCGAKMLAAHCMADMTFKYNRFLQLVDDRDRWQSRYPETQKLHDLFVALGQARFIERMMQNHDCELTEKEEWLVSLEASRKAEYIEKLESKMTIEKVSGHPIGFVLCDARYASDAGHHLYDKFNLEAVVLVNAETVSLRAPPDSKFDMAGIAQCFKGGGHRGAAGMHMNNVLQTSLIDQVISRIGPHQIL